MRNICGLWKKIKIKAWGEIAPNAKASNARLKKKKRHFWLTPLALYLFGFVPLRLVFKLLSPNPQAANLINKK